MEITGADIVVESLLEQGVSSVFGYPGGAALEVFDALGKRRRDIRVCLPAHEQGGCHAADGFARAGGGTGVMIATSGPGATNLVTGLAAAFMDSIPMVAITVNVARPLIGRDSFQEVDICGVTTPVTKHNFFVGDISKLAATIREAFVIANSGRPGPVLVDITRDVTAGFCEYTPAGRFERRPVPPPPHSALRQAAAMLDAASRPLIFCGGGVLLSRGSDSLRRFAELCSIPVSTSLMGLTALPFDHPLMLGMLGMHGTEAANRAVETCDLLICVGTRFSDRVAGDRKLFAPHAKLIHIDIDPSEFDKNVVCDLHICGDAGEVLTALAAHAPPPRGDGWLSELGRTQAEASDRNDGRHPNDDSIRPGALLCRISDLAGPSATIVTDVGQHQMWTAQHYPFTRPGSLVTSGGLGAMGFGLGAAVGAKAACPERPVVLITGDGSFHMNLAELSTAIAEDLPVVVVVMNNGVLGMVRQWQHMFCQGRYFGTESKRKTDFAAAAAAFGGLGFRAATMDEATTAITEALASGRTCVVDCAIDPNEFVFPMIPPGKPGSKILTTKQGEKQGDAKQGDGSSASQKRESGNGSIT